MTDDDGTLKVHRNDAQGRYEAFLGGDRVGIADFFEVNGVVVLPHVETDPRWGGRGYAGQLTQATLDDLRSRGKRIVAQCPFVQAWLAKHRDYQDLIAR